MKQSKYLEIINKGQNSIHRAKITRRFVGIRDKLRNYYDYMVYTEFLYIILTNFRIQRIN